MEKIVKGATKIKLAAPKSKYIEPILSATNGGESGVAEIFRTLQLRLRDSTWTIVFKSLIVVHLMIREGRPEVTLKYIAESPKRLAISSFTEVQTQGLNIRRYAEYLLERVRGYRETQCDLVKAGAGKMRKLTVEKGLLRHTEAIQDQINALLRCDLLGSHDPDNEISLTAFRLLTMDLLELYKVMNEGTIRVLENYFEMSRPDAERALNIYKTFSSQTDQVVQYLSLARQYEMSTRLEVPKLKHAPTTLTRSLEEYLNDPDFEINRRQYLAQIEAKRSGKPVPTENTNSVVASKPTKTELSAIPATNKAPQAPAKGPAPDLIDFFDSIEQNRQQMAQPPVTNQQQFTGYPQAQQYQQTQLPSQQTGYNPFFQQSFPQPGQAQQSQLQPDFTGAGFGGYTPQPQQQPQYNQNYSYNPSLNSIPQNGVSDFQQHGQTQFQQHVQPQPIQPQPTSTNPFRQSMMTTGSSSPFQTGNGAIRRQSTNPFAKANTGPPLEQSSNSTPIFNQSSNSPFPNPQHQTQQEELQSSSSFFGNSISPVAEPQSFQPAPIQAQRTGTNPFAKNRSPPPTGPVVTNVTGSTNPFRQSTFVNQQTGQGWQHNNQGNLSGYNVTNVDTIPVFPRPGQS